MYKLLIVDDEELIRKGLQQIINWSNYGIELCATACCAEEALGIIRTSELSLIITDVRMPGISGISMIEQALKIHPHLKCIVLSGYSDYDLIRSAMRAGAVDYLLKPIAVNELTDSIEAVIRQIEKNENFNKQVTEQYLFQATMQRIIQSKISIKEKRERLEYFNINQDYEHVMLSLIRTALEAEAVITLLKSTFFSFKEGLLLFEDGKGNICSIFLSNQQIETEAIKKKLSDCISIYSEKSGHDVYGVLSPHGSSFRQLPELYNLCSRNLDYALFHSANHLVTCESQGQASLSAEIDITLLRDYLINNNFSAIQKYLTELFTNANITSTCREADMLSVIILNHALEIAIALLINQDQADSIKARALSLLKTMPDLTSKIRTLCSTMRTISVLIASKQNRDYSHLIKMATEYIDINYYDCSLCLKTLADLLKIHPSYLGRQFKMETSEFFNDYLARVRVKQAEQMLRTTSMKISEIAEVVGFSSVNYFGMVFKKITLVTPSDFRK